MNRMLHSCKDLSDADLLAGLDKLTHDGRLHLADLLAHLGEVDHRRLYLEKGCSSLFAYAVERLHFSDDGAAKRIQAARAARLYPVILEYVAKGELHLTAVTSLAPHLTPDNHAELLLAARHMTNKQVERLIVARYPKPDSPTLLRRLPETRVPGLPLSTTTARTTTSDEARGQVAMASGAAFIAKNVYTSDAYAAPSSEPVVASSPSPLPFSLRPKVTPLSSTRYRLQVTVSSTVEAQLRRAQALMRHRNPSGDLAVVLEETLALLVTKLEGQRLGKRQGTRKAAATRKAATLVSPSEPTPQSATPAVGSSAALVPEQVSQPVAHHAAPAPEQVSQPVADHTAPAPKQVSQPAAAPAPKPRSAAPRADITPEPLSTAIQPTDHQRSRYIPRSIRRAVVERDGERCTCVSSDGHRCSERGFLELHHILPFARGGEHTVEGLTLRCRAHNGYQAALDFGAEHMQWCTDGRRWGEAGVARPRPSPAGDTSATESGRI